MAGAVSDPPRTRQPLVDTLLWTAGRDDIAPDFGAVDMDALFEVLHAHRMDARFCVRLRGSPHARGHPELLRRSEARLREIHDEVEQRGGLARDLAAASGPGRWSLGDIVPLKGFTLYGLTGDPDTVRHSGDLDVLAGNPADVVHAAQQLGFVLDGPTEILDEYARLVAPKYGMIEVHSYVPMPRWSPLDTATVCDPAANPRHWRHEVSLPHHHVEFDDLAGELVPAAGLPAGVVVLRPEAALLVQAAHMFGDYVRTVIPLPAGTVRLDEIAALGRMAALPHFESARFRRLMAALHADDVVSFARTLSVDLLGHDPLEEALGPFVRPTVVPVDLWWDGVDGFLTDLGWRPDQLVVRDERPLDVLRRLGTSAVSVPLGSSTTIRALTTAGPQAERIVYRTAPGQHMDAEVEFVAGEQELTLHISVPAAAPGGTNGVSCNFGDQRWEAFFRGPDRPLAFDDYSLPGSGAEGADRTVLASAEAGRAAGRDTFRIVLPWPRLGGTPRGRTEPLPLLLGLRRQEGYWGATEAGIILPLELGIDVP